MNKFNIYNKSSEDMSEVADGSIDLVFTSPPYNIGTKYSTNTDLLSFEKYKEMLGLILNECSRVLKSDGKIIIECADTVFSQDRYISLSGLIADILKNVGFKLENRFINFIKSENGFEQIDHNWNSDYSTLVSAHSNCHQILVLSRGAKFKNEGEVLYFEYPENEEEHPCPSNIELIKVILEKYFKENFSVLDPFMGTARLGEEVIKKGGVFYGYEKEKMFFEIVSKRLQIIK
jgi:DNA modification methylase